MHAIKQMPFTSLQRLAVLVLLSCMLATSSCSDHRDQVARSVESYLIAQKPKNAHPVIDSFTITDLQPVSQRKLMEALRDYYAGDAAHFQHRKTVDSVEWRREMRIHDSFSNYFNALPEYNKIDTALAKTVHNSYLLDSGYLAASLHAADSIQALGSKADDTHSDCFAATARYGISTTTATEVRTIRAYLDDKYKVVLVNQAQ